MRIPPFNYPLDDRLLQKIDLMVARCIQKNPKRDAVLLFEGPEGEGKTTFSVAIGYYVRWKTGRGFNHKNLFFDLKKMIPFAQKTEEQIMVWDEPALQALSKDALSTIVKDLERLFMMARKKRHFIMINMAYFNKFSEYIVWQRPLGMIHVYSRRQVQAGRYVYIKKNNLEQLWHDWRRRRKRSYRKFCSKSIRGTFPDILNPNYKNNVLSDFDINYYEKEKDAAIMLIGSKESKKDELLKYKVMIFKLVTKLRKKYREQALPLLKEIELNDRTYRHWVKKIENEEIPLVKQV